MNDLEKQSYESFSVSFRVIGSTLEPSKLTVLFEMDPDIEHKKGDPRTGKAKNGKTKHYTPFDTGLWSIESKLEKHVSIQEHIVNLLERIEPKKDVIEKLRNTGFKMDFYCGYFFSITSQAGISLTNDILKRISELGIDFGVDLYAI
jgi:hypothetical protein